MRLLIVAALFAAAANAQFSTVWTELADPGGRVSVNPVTGQLAYDRVVSGFFEVHTADADGSNETCISCGHASLPSRHIGNPVWSPDGEWIVMQAQAVGAAWDAFATPGIGTFNYLYAYEVDTTTVTQIHTVPLTTPAKGLLHAQFNHAGDKLMWAEMTDASVGFNGDWEITVADWNPATPALSNLTDYAPSSKTFYETHGWSPDDSVIIYTAAAGAFTDLDIWTWDLSGTPVNLTDDVSGAWDEHAHISRDGQYIVWMSSREQSFSPLQTDYWIMRLDGSGKRRLTSFSDSGAGEYRGYNAIAADFDWSVDGRTVVGYVQENGTTPDDGELIEVEVRNPPAQPVRWLTLAGVFSAPQDAAATSCASGEVQVGDACEPFGAALDLLLGATDR